MVDREDTASAYWQVEGRATMRAFSPTVFESKWICERAAAFVVMAAAASCNAATIPAAEAGKFVGREATVTGQVVQIAQIPAGSGPLFIDLDGAHPNRVFQAVILPKDFANFGGNPRTLVRDKRIEVTGRILAQGRIPRILVAAPDQIRVLPETAPPAEAAASPSATQKPAPGAKVSDSSPPLFTKKDRSSLPPNLLKNPSFSQSDQSWELNGNAKVITDSDGNTLLRVELDPKKSIHVSQKFSGIPRDAIQFQAFFRVQLTPESSLKRPLMLRMGPDLDNGSHLPRPLRAKPGNWQEVIWTRTSDLPGIPSMIFDIEIPPGQGALLIDDAYLFAHPDWKDKSTWKVSDG
jgi:hypothetical protein